MTSLTIHNTEAALRRAVEQQQFSEVEALALVYCGLVDGHLSTLPVGDPARMETLTRVIGILKWTRLMLTTARAAHSDRLDNLLKTKRYFAPAGAGSPGVRVDF